MARVDVTSRVTRGSYSRTSFYQQRLPNNFGRPNWFLPLFGFYWLWLQYIFRERWLFGIWQHWNINTSQQASVRGCKRNTSRTLMRKRGDDPSFHHGIACCSPLSSLLISIQVCCVLPFITMNQISFKRIDPISELTNWEILLEPGYQWEPIILTSVLKAIPAAVVRNRFRASLHHLCIVPYQYRAEYKLQAPMKSGNSFMQIATWYLIMPLELQQHRSLRCLDSLMKLRSHDQSVPSSILIMGLESCTHFLYKQMYFWLLPRVSKQENNASKCMHSNSCNTNLDLVIFS